MDSFDIDSDFDYDACEFAKTITSPADIRDLTLELQGRLRRVMSAADQIPIFGSFLIEESMSSMSFYTHIIHYGEYDDKGCRHGYEFKLAKGTAESRLIMRAHWYHGELRRMEKFYLPDSSDTFSDLEWHLASIRQYKDGHKNGKWTTWHNWGGHHMKRTRNYSCGLLHGEQIGFIDDGRLQERTVYRMGVPCSVYRRTYHIVQDGGWEATEIMVQSCQFVDHIPINVRMYNRLTGRVYSPMTYREVHSLIDLALSAAGKIITRETLSKVPHELMWRLQCATPAIHQPSVFGSATWTIALPSGLAIRVWAQHNAAGERDGPYAEWVTWRDRDIVDYIDNGGSMYYPEDTFCTRTYPGLKPWIHYELSDGTLTDPLYLSTEFDEKLCRAVWNHNLLHGTYSQFSIFSHPGTNGMFDEYNPPDKLLRISRASSLHYRHGLRQGYCLQLSKHLGDYIRYRCRFVDGLKTSICYIHPHSTSITQPHGWVYGRKHSLQRSPYTHGTALYDRGLCLHKDFYSWVKDTGATERGCDPIMKEVYVSTWRASRAYTFDTDTWFPFT